MLSPLDDLPVHQIAEPISYVGTSDRNFYDRYYFNLFERSGAVMATAGLGVYPNLGVADAFVAATYADRQHVVRASRELGANRADTTVGPISIEVLEGLRRLRLRATGDDAPVELDVTWEAAIPAFLEARHVNRRAARLTTETARFAQTGSWTGTLRIADERFDVSAPDWSGGRDRSWGVRPVGEPEPAGRRSGGGPGGFLWLYSTMQFDDFTILCILQEDRTGRRSLEQAVRLWPESAGRDPEPLGQIHHELEFVAGSRRVAAAQLTFTPVQGAATAVTVEPIATSFLSLGTGYGMDADWRHGMYQGPLAVQYRSYDVADPAVRAGGYGLMDDLGRFELDGTIGYGLFENAVLGPNDRYGFAAR
jgi:hypothetical protein